MKLVWTVLVSLALATPLWADDPADLKPAIAKGLKRVEAGIINYPKNRQCFSCHHQAMAVMTLVSAKQHGLPVDDDLLQTQITFSMKTFKDRARIAKGQGIGGETTSAVYMLATFAAAGHPRDETTTALVEYLLVRQGKDGSWGIPGFGERPPTMGSIYTNVGLALAGLKHYGAPQDADRIDAAIKKGVDWLLANKPASTEDRVFHLRGLVDGGAKAKDIEAARAQLLKEQRPDGSWAQLPKMSGDAYATGTALMALRYAGLDAAHDAYKKGVWYLLDTQTEEGAWVVQTRSKPLQTYFDNGDAGGKSQFISFAATNWALQALMEALPKRKINRVKNAGR